MLKSILIYVVLVGTPLAGLVGILQVGGDLQPPPSIAGTWQLDAPEAAACLGSEPAEIAIEQSGLFLRVAVAGHRVEARLRDGSFALDTVFAEGACEGQALHLEGTIGEDARTLSGRLTTECAACGDPEFSATRTPTEPKPAR